MLRSFKLTIEYDGTEFCGWQRQPGKRTVQGEMERACLKATGHAVRVTGAGRTDAGVHAAGQAASAELAWKGGRGELMRALNAALPADVAVMGIEEKPDGFNARWDAVEREYRYAILHRDVRSPLLRHFACWEWRDLDLAAMKRAAACFMGRHDFSSFCAADPSRQGKVRWVTRCSVSRRGDLILLDVSCGSFLRHMVRLMAGAILAVGRRQIGVGAVRRALESTGRRLAVNAAPARGLALVGVRYPGDRAKRAPDWPFPDAQ